MFLKHPQAYCHKVIKPQASVRGREHKSIALQEHFHSNFLSRELKVVIEIKSCVADCCLQLGRLSYIDGFLPKSCYSIAYALHVVIVLTCRSIFSFIVKFKKKKKKSEICFYMYSLLETILE